MRPPPLDNGTPLILYHSPMPAEPNATRPMFYLALIIAAAVAAGCSIFHWSGYPPQKHPTPENEAPLSVPAPPPYAAAASTAPAPSPRLTEAELNARYYYDLGPDSIDVSQYPQNQQANYKVFAQLCSQCHSLARAINSPRSNHVAWEYYIFRKRLRSKFAPGKGFGRREASVSLSFLDYDSKMRKGKYREDFEALSGELQRHFDRVLYHRMRLLQEQAPRLGGER